MTEDKHDSGKKKIAIIDDHPIVRQGLAELIDCQDDLTVCAEAEDAPEALKVIKKTNPDLAVIDISLKDSNGIELIRDLKIQKPLLPVLVLSMHDESFYAERVLRAGARGYVTKAEASETVIAAIRAVLAGEVYLSRKMASKMLSKFVDGSTEAEAMPIRQLGDRELQVFELIGRGLTTRDIAKKLHVSVKTVDSHRDRIKGKLKLQNATELLQHAIQWVQVEHAG